MEGEQLHLVAIGLDAQPRRIGQAFARIATLVAPGPEPGQQLFGAALLCCLLGQQLAQMAQVGQGALALGGGQVPWCHVHQKRLHHLLDAARLPIFVPALEDLDQLLPGWCMFVVLKKLFIGPAPQACGRRRPQRRHVMLVGHGMEHHLQFPGHISCKDALLR